MSQSEADGFTKNGQFCSMYCGFEGKQLGFRLGEMHSFANLDFNSWLYNSIASVRIPTTMISQFTVTETDAFVLHSGVLTSAGGQISLFNSLGFFSIFSIVSCKGRYINVEIWYWSKGSEF